MTVRKEKKKAVAKYMSKAYDEIKLRVKKGKREEIKEHAEARGESVNGFINRAIDNQIERDNGEPDTE